MSRKFQKKIENFVISQKTISKKLKTSEERIFLVIFTTYNSRQNIEDKFTELCKIDVSLEFFTTDSSNLSGLTVQI